MKEGMSGLDIKVVVEELEDITNSWMGKAYEIDGVFLLKLNHPQKGKKNLIIEPGKRIHLTTMKHPTPKHPPDFAMLLRKYLKNTKLTEIKQPDLERIVELKFERNKKRYVLIAELFGDGNLLLCDENHKIIQAYESKEWKHRKLKSGEIYELPPKKSKDISTLSKKVLKKALSDSPNLVKGLARNLNIGGNLAEEICAKAGLKKEKSPENLTKSDYEKLYSTIQNLLSAEISPRVVYKNNKAFTALPFPFKTMDGLESETFERFNRALDYYFQQVAKRLAKEKREKILEDKLDEVRSRLKRQKKHLQKLKKQVKEAKKKADAITTHHEQVDNALRKLMEMKESKNWGELKKEIEENFEAEENWTKLIETVRPKGGEVVVNLPETSATIDLRKSSFENASKFYDKYKRSKEKIGGARKAIEDTENELRELKEEGIEVPKKTVPKKRREKKWYERYRWFRSSDGILVIAGRDANTNQEIVEKHMEPQDRYLHADLEGAPHTVIKSKGKEIPDSTTEEAAKFAAMHSRAWRRGLGSVDVYWADPEQVSEETPSGEYLPKGSYMIKGDRNYQTVPLEAGVGLLKRNEMKIPICGPPSATKNHSDVLIEIKPGPTKKSDLAHQIKEQLENETERKISVDEIMQILPPGQGMIVK